MIIRTTKGGFWMEPAKGDKYEKHQVEQLKGRRFKVVRSEEDIKETDGAKGEFGLFFEVMDDE